MNDFFSKSGGLASTKRFRRAALVSILTMLAAATLALLGVTTREGGYVSVHQQRNLLAASSFSDPKSVFLKDQAPFEPLQLEEMSILDRLKATEQLWIASKFNREEVRAASLRYAEEDERRASQSGRISPLQICDRPTGYSMFDPPTLPSCPEFSKDKPMMVLKTMAAKGRTGNNLIELLHAIQKMRDEPDMQLGIVMQSWAMKLITSMWFEIKGDDEYVATDNDAEDDVVLSFWKERFELTFCIKVFVSEDELKGWENAKYADTNSLFMYGSTAPLANYMASQLGILRAFWSNYNTGRGVDYAKNPTRDNCAGVRAIFPSPEERNAAVYTVIHSRQLEGAAGERIMQRASKKAMSDPRAALDMTPEYVKGILRPLGMLQHPIVFISDNQKKSILEDLLADSEIGPMIRVVDPEHTSLTGDITLAVLSNVFIGNPASSFSTFIAKSRLALGFGHNELWKAKSKKTKLWYTTCGDNCLFDRKVMGNQK
ncbi:hypothetical protein ACHAWF_010215 [Thalassiosira exigua]